MRGEVSNLRSHVEIQAKCFFIFQSLWLLLRNILVFRSVWSTSWWQVQRRQISEEPLVSPPGLYTHSTLGMILWESSFRPYPTFSEAWTFNSWVSQKHSSTNSLAGWFRHTKKETSAHPLQVIQLLLRLSNWKHEIWMSSWRTNCSSVLQLCILQLFPLYLVSSLLLNPLSLESIS